MASMGTERRTRFRDYMRRLDPTGDPAKAVAGGFYVPPPNAVSRRIATRIELQPNSHHLMVGGIGSGKSTELIAIERALVEVEDLLPVRIDVPSRHRVDKLQPGVLIALAATEACAELERERERGLIVAAEVEQQVRRVSVIAKGYWEDVNSFGEPDYGERWVQGVLQAPELSDSVKSLAEALIQVHGALQRKLVLLFDGLDRVADLAALAALLAEDIPAMGRAGVGVVVIGPQHLRFGPQRSIESVFETVHLHGAVGVDTSEAQTFLTSVLRARVDEAVLPQDSAAALVSWSGGLMRDLIALGRAAGAEAYADGSETVQTSHVGIAADRFGRALLLGCTKEMVTRLKLLVPKRHVLPAGRAAPRENLPAFTVATELDQRLLVERLIIEIPDTPVRYVLHPTIVPLIPGLGGS